METVCSAILINGSLKRFFLLDTRCFNWSRFSSIATGEDFQVP